MNRETDIKQTSQLLIKFLKDELSGQELETFELWLQADPKNKELVESFRDTSSVQQELNYVHSINVKEGWESLSERLNEKPVTRIAWKKILPYSAAAILIIALSTWTYKTKFQNNSENLSDTSASTKEDVMPGSKKARLRLADGSRINLNESGLDLNTEDGKLAVAARRGVIMFSSRRKKNTSKGYNMVETPRAGEYRMILPDGTKVWLNASSFLEFPASFNITNRRVHLSGEAYFEVAHNKTKPFIVTFKDTEVEVLGTHFNINTFGLKSQTTLLEGAVKITEGNVQKTLKPGEEAEISEGTLNIHKADLYKSIAWKEGIFYFNQDPLKDILNEISKWYDVEIAYNGNPTGKKYSGNIRRQATLNQVLEMLNAVSGEEFILKNRTVTVNFK